MQEDYEVIARAAFGIMQAYVTNICETMLDSELALRLHGDNRRPAHRAGISATGRELFASSSGTSIFILRSAVEKVFPLRVGHQGQRAAAAETFVQQKIKGAEIRQLKSFDFAFADSPEMFLDAFGSHFANQQRIELIAQGNQTDVGGVAFIAGTRMSKFG